MWWTMITLIISHVHVLREAMAAALHGAEDNEAFAAASQETVEAVALKFPPSLVLVDVSHPEGMSLVTWVRAYLPEVKVMVLATRERDEDFFAWAEIGISGYLGPDTSAREILDAVQRAEAGEVICSPRLTALMLTRLTGAPNGRTARGSIHELTCRELEVAGLLAEGMSNKGIARQMCVAVATAKNHVHSVLDKWNVRSRGEAAARYREQVQKNVERSGAEFAARRASRASEHGGFAWQNSGARTGTQSSLAVAASISPLRAIAGNRPQSLNHATVTSLTRSSSITSQ